ncbi:MAG: S41 family peptidase [Candidatus Saganbacteria bacterium]|nr:S41 family peptidase [Candidatus Saganbacteria bacterium]
MFSKSNASHRGKGQHSARGVAEGRFRVLRNIVLAIMVVVVGVSIFSRVTAQEGLERKLETYLQVLDIVKNDYVQKDVDDQKLVYGSIRGMLSALDDPYTRFVEPKAYEEMKIRMSGIYSGIGIYIGMKDNQLTVISPIEGTPADKGHLKAGDKIMTVDGKVTKDMALEEAVSLIRGPRGTKVVLGILRQGWGKPKDVGIVRDNIKIQCVKTKQLDGNIAYIKLNTFENLASAREFEKALRQARDANGLIIDLRGNGGGLLQSAISIGSMFVDKGVIVQTVDREGRKEQIESTGRVLWRKPTVVLINEASASASEILAGALRDNKKATLVGSNSFGKASVQNVRRLSDGSALLVTIAKYLTPNGEDINEKGISPDVLVLVPTLEVEALLILPDQEGEDIQLEKAVEVLNGMIKG